MENKKIVSTAREGINKTRIEAASELDTAMNNKYREKITFKGNNSLVKRLVEQYERNLIGK